MIEYTSGNIFECNADCLINAVNCEGVMGKGLAYQFKMKFPENNKSYIKACKAGELTVGKVHHYLEKGIVIVNFPTKNKWRENSKIEYIEEGMSAFAALLPELAVKKIAIPPLGCGNGGLIWADVRKIIENKISGLADRYDFMIFEPVFSDHVLEHAALKKPPQMGVPELVLLDMRLHLEKYNQFRLQKMGCFVNLFLEEEYFKYDQWKAGPYSRSVEAAARNIKEYKEYYGINLRCGMDNDRTIFEQVYQVICSEKVDDSFRRLHTAVEKAAAYVNEIRSDKKLEGIAAALYLVRNEETSIKNSMKDRDDRFSDEEICECIEYLEKISVI